MNGFMSLTNCIELLEMMKTKNSKIITRPQSTFLQRISLMRIVINMILPARNGYRHIVIEYCSRVVNLKTIFTTIAEKAVFQITDQF